MPPNTVKVSRPSFYGNPFRIGYDGVRDAETAVQLFREWLERIDYNFRGMEAYPEYAYTRTGIRASLKDKNLACWCPLDQPCHADVLLEIANS